MNLYAQFIQQAEDSAALNAGFTFLHITDELMAAINHAAKIVLPDMLLYAPYRAGFT